MLSEIPPNLVLREAVTEDGTACGQICYNAFSAINTAHGFPCDFPGQRPPSASLP